MTSEHNSKQEEQSKKRQKQSASTEDLQREALMGKIQSIFTPTAVKKQSNATTISSQDEHSKEREEFINFLKNKKEYFQYIILAIIIGFGTFIRTRNLRLLKDATTGDYIPLALDPYLFTRYANEIIETGTLAAYDYGRFVPEGISTIKYWMTSYFIAYLYKFMSIFSDTVTVNYASVIYPVVCFAIAMVFFFLLCKRLFNTNIALLATAFLTVVPSFLHRTMAGFADHEALGTMFMFMATYWYICGWQTKSTKKIILFGALAGLATGAMGVTWGGWKFLILMISGFTIIEFFLAKTKRADLYQYASWTAGYLLVTTLLIPQYSLGDLVASFTTAIAFLVLFILALHELLQLEQFKTFQDKLSGKIPNSITTALIAGVLGIIGIFTVVGVDTIVKHGTDIINGILHPLGNNRWELTVAEQHQPYFTDWMSQYGPQLFNSIPIYLLLFMAGSVLLFYAAIKSTKHKVKLTTLYVAFLIAFTMSRYSSSSTFNGINGISISVYIGSLLAFAAVLAGLFLYSFYKDKVTYEKIMNIEKKYIFILVWFLIMVVAARGAVRLFYIFTPITALLASFAVFEIGNHIKRIPHKLYQVFALVLLLFVIFSPLSAPLQGALPAFAESSIGQASYSGPGYTHQWQTAGEWVRNNIPEDAVFSHWWDYGYWVQTGWDRATVLDGTNKITYWNFLMGRYVMTGQTQTEALEWLDVHEATHFLIVPEEIGKYTAYSSIGSDKDFDRYSWITTFSLDQSLMHETRNSTVIGFRGSYVFDENVVYEDRVYPSRNSGVGAVYLELNLDEENNFNGLHNAYVIASSQHGQTEMPLTCVYMGDEFYFFNHENQNAYNGCFRVIPTLNNDGSVASPLGAGLFVSEKGFKALWTNLYLFDGKNPYFDTSAFSVAFDQSTSYAPLSVINGRVIGPIKIWEINYPEGFTVSDELREQYLGHNENLPDYFFDVN